MNQGKNSSILKLLKKEVLMRLRHVALAAIAALVLAPGSVRANEAENTQALRSTTRSFTPPTFEYQPLATPAQPVDSWQLAFTDLKLAAALYLSNENNDAYANTQSMLRYIGNQADMPNSPG